MSFGGSSRRWRRWVALLLWALTDLLIRGVPPCQANTPALQSVSEMYHTSWTIRDGVPSSIEAVAQTRDGYIWLATDTGLFRFDGQRFERYHPSSGEDFYVGTMPSLMAAPDGGLWIGYAFAGASYLREGHNVNFGKREGLIAGSINRFARDRQGVIWAASNAALWRHEGTQWKKVDSSWGYSADHAVNVFVDHRGTVWVGSGTELLYLTEGSRRFEVALRQADDLYSMAEAPDGTLWIALANSGQVRPLADPDGELIEHPRLYAFQARKIGFDNAGALWVATDTAGLYRLPRQQPAPPGAPGRDSEIQHFSADDGLTSDNTYDLLQGAEGGTWVVSTKGLDRFRRSALTAVTLPRNWFRIGIVADGPNSVLAAATGLVRIDRNGVAPLTASLKQVASAYRDPHGSIWIGGESDGLWRYTAKGLEPVPLPDGLDPLFHVAQTMTMDRSGGLWVSFLHTGFLYYAQGRWTHPTFPTASRHEPGLSAYTDSAGRVWFGMKNSRVETLDGAQHARFGPESGVDVGDVGAIYERSGTVWLGGSGGVDFQQRDRFYSLRLAGDEPLEGVSGIIQRASGELWINQASGIVRIAADEVTRVRADPQYRPRFVLYNYLDGLTDTASQIRPNPTLLETDSGRIYIATRTGIVWIDPDDPHEVGAPPSVFVNSISVDDTVTRDATDVRLPVNANSIEINYTATSMLIPERVRFRYELEGFDRDWQEAGTRRQAFYSGLPPGRYRFRVMACNSEGVWNERGATLGIEIPPSFLQSLTFKVLCATLAAALLALLYRIRLQLVTRQVKARLYERLAERERIARDLHDTFFQAIQGLLLRFNTGTSLLKPDEPARAIFDEALRQSDQVMLEGRDLVLDLRSGDAVGRNLPESFVAAEAQLRAIHATGYKVIVHGEPRELHPLVVEELYRLGREALINAFRHSCASSIEVEMIYDPGGLRLRFRDDGIGIDPGILSRGGRDNHWGLPGMRERARKIGAELEIWSREDAGTEIEVRVAAAIAYSTLQKSFDAQLSAKRRAQQSEFS